MSNHRRRIVVTKSEQFERASFALREVAELDRGAGLRVVVLPANFAGAVPQKSQVKQMCVVAAEIPPELTLE